MIKTQKIIYTSLLSGLVLSTMAVQPVRAQEAKPDILYRTNVKDTIKTAIQQKNLDLKKTNAVREIDRRVNTLNGLISRINNIKRLTVDQKNSLISQIQSQITSLQSLKTKIDEDTDADTLKQDKKEIVDSYRIYALFLPKITILSHADSILSLVDIMKSKTSNTDALTKINDAYTQTENAIALVIGLTPEGYPGNKSSLQSAKNMLEVARKDLNAARVLMKK